MAPVKKPRISSGHCRVGFDIKREVIQVVKENTICKMSQGNEATSQVILGGVHAPAFWTQYLLVTW